MTNEFHNNRGYKTLTIMFFPVKRNIETSISRGTDISLLMERAVGGKVLSKKKIIYIKYIYI